MKVPLEMARGSCVVPEQFVSFVEGVLQFWVMKVAGNVRFRVPFREASQSVCLEDRLEATVQTPKIVLYCALINLRVTGENGEQESEVIHPGGSADRVVDVVLEFPVYLIPRDSRGGEDLGVNHFLKAYPDGGSTLFEGCKGLTHGSFLQEPGTRPSHQAVAGWYPDHVPVPFGAPSQVEAVGQGPCFLAGSGDPLYTISCAIGPECRHGASP